MTHRTPNRRIGPGSAAPPVSEETKARVAELWATGLSASKIGERMGITKNAVIGVKNRLSLPARESPIKAKRVETKLGIGTRMQAAAQGTGAVAQAPPPEARWTTQHGAPVAFTPLPVLLARPFAAVRRCQYPMWGDRERPTMQFCDAPVGRRGDGSPLVYCSTHNSACHSAGTPSERAALRDAAKVAA